MRKIIALAALVAAMPMAAKASNGNPCTATNAVVAAQTANMQSIAAIRKGVSLGAITQQELLRDLDQLIAQDEEYLARKRDEMRHQCVARAGGGQINVLPAGLAQPANRTPRQPVEQLAGGLHGLVRYGESGEVSQAPLATNAAHASISARLFDNSPAPIYITRNKLYPHFLGARIHPVL